MTRVTDRLKALRYQARPKISVRRMAEALGMPASTYAAYEDPAKFKKPILPLDLAKAIAEVLAPAGVARADVLALAGVTGEFSLAPSPGDADEWLEVQGAVAGGVWREQTDWPAGERYQVRFGPSRFTKEQRFAVRMEGLSMNKVIPPNSDLECLWVKFSDTPPQPGDLVIVERHAHDLVEMTCKRLARDGEDYILVAESTEPAFSEPIRLGRPDEGLFTDDEIRVIGIVLSAKLSLAPANLDERRYPRI
jgi:SOS-response transcriptional repressor LexA